MTKMIQIWSLFFNLIVPHLSLNKPKWSFVFCFFEFVYFRAHSFMCHICIIQNKEIAFKDLFEDFCQHDWKENVCIESSNFTSINHLKYISIENWIYPLHKWRTFGISVGRWNILIFHLLRRCTWNIREKMGTTFYSKCQIIWQSTIHTVFVMEQLNPP